MNNNYGYDFKNDSEKEENSEPINDEIINNNIYSNQNNYNYDYNIGIQSNPMNDNYGYNRTNNITGDNKEFNSNFENNQKEMDFNKFENYPMDNILNQMNKDDYIYNEKKNFEYIENPNYNEGNYNDKNQRFNNEIRDFESNKIINPNSEHRRNTDFNFNKINSSNIKDREKLLGVIKEETENNDNNNKMDDPLSLFEGLGRRRRGTTVSPNSINQNKNDKKSNSKKKRKLKVNDEE